MNQGPLIFLGAFFTLMTSWVGMVLAPQLQIGKQGAVATEDTAGYPYVRPGLANQGAEIYRANGCVVCHSQQTRQTGLTFDLRLLKVGTNRSEVAKIIGELKKDAKAAEVRGYMNNAPINLVEGMALEKADQYAKRLTDAGATSDVNYRPLGPDIQLGYGMRATVAQDYLRDEPPMIGNVRLGPDLANEGIRRPQPTFLYYHLYNPRQNTPGSIMPAHTFLFEKRKIGAVPAKNALRLIPPYTVEAGWEVVPKPEADALVAYLTSLKASVSLPEAPSPKPMPVADAPAGSAP